LFFVLWYLAILVPESFDSAYQGVRHSDLLIACRRWWASLQAGRECMWSGALIYLVVLGWWRAVVRRLPDEPEHVILLCLLFA
jgi:hypothetical protein